MSTKKKYTATFKKQIVSLSQTGKSVAELSKEYELSKVTIYSWIKQYNQSRSFKTVDNLSDVEKENIRLKKELAEARMHVDILKQAALIMGQKSK